MTECSRAEGVAPCIMENVVKASRHGVQIPRPHIQKQVGQQVLVILLLGAPTSQSSQSVISGFSERFCLKRIKWREMRKTSIVDLWHQSETGTQDRIWYKLNLANTMLSSRQSHLSLSNLPDTIISMAALKELKSLVSSACVCTNRTPGPLISLRRRKWNNSLLSFPPLTYTCEAAWPLFGQVKRFNR